MHLILNTLNIAECTSCLLHKKCSSPLSGYLKGQTPDLMVISERPSKEEDFVTTQFFDRANLYLRKLVEQVFPSYYMTYTLKCYNQLTLSQAKKTGPICVSSWLFKELHEFKPKILLCMGEISFELITKFLVPGLSKYKENIGKTHYRLFENNIITTWYSPHYIFNGSKLKELQFIKFLKELKGKIIDVATN